MELLDAVVAQAGGTLPDLLIETIVDATELRSSVHHEALPTEGPADLHDQLIKHRKALDRLEDLVAKLGRLRAKADMLVRERQDWLEDAEAQATKLGEEYATALERNNHIRAQTLDERITVRKATRQRDEISEAHEYVKTLYRGLDGSRRDIDARIRLITMQTSLEK